MTTPEPSRAVPRQFIDFFRTRPQYSKSEKGITEEILSDHPLPSRMDTKKIKRKGKREEHTVSKRNRSALFNCVVMKRSEAEARAQLKYESKIRRFIFKLNPEQPEEKEMIDYLESSGNKQGTLKRALSRYMADKRNETTPPE